MKVKVFSARDNEGQALIESSASEKMGYRLNEWLDENPDIEIVKIEQSPIVGRRSGENGIILTLFYEEKSKKQD